MLLAFAVVSVSVAIVSWFYESIRIPTLNGQLAFRDDKLKAVELEVQKEHEKVKATEENLSIAKAELSKWRGNSEQAFAEISQLSVKLQQLQEAHAKAIQDFSTLKLTRKANENLQSSSSNLRARSGLNFEQMVYSVAAQEDAAFLTIDKKVTDLRFTAYAMMRSEVDELTDQHPTHIDDLKSFSERLVTTVRQYWEFRVALERLRVHAINIILAHYRKELANSEKLVPNEFLSNTRKKPAIVEKTDELAKKLLARTESAQWNSNAIKIVDTFIASNKVTSVVGP